MTGSRSAAYGGCYGKKRFPSYWSASRAAKNLNYFVEGVKANPYRCEACHFYHVGGSTGRGKEKRSSRHTIKEKYKNGRI